MFSWSSIIGGVLFGVLVGAFLQSWKGRVGAPWGCLGSIIWWVTFAGLFMAVRVGKRGEPVDEYLFASIAVMVSIILYPVGFLIIASVPKTKELKELEKPKG